MFKITAKVETKSGTRNETRLNVKEADVDRTKQAIKAELPAGSTVTIKVKRV